MVPVGSTFVTMVAVFPLAGAVVHEEVMPIPVMVMVVFPLFGKLAAGTVKVPVPGEPLVKLFMGAISPVAVLFPLKL